MTRKDPGARSEIHFKPERGSSSNMCLNRSHLDDETGCLAACGIQWGPRSPFFCPQCDGPPPSLPLSVPLPATALDGPGPNPNLPAWAELPERGAARHTSRFEAPDRPTATAREPPTRFRNSLTPGLVSGDGIVQTYFMHRARGWKTLDY